jgi:uncharacterized protein
MSNDSELRIESIDALRGIAVCGIFFVNISVMLDFSLYTPETRYSVDWWTLTFSAIYLEGTMRGIFSILFGVSLALMLSKGVPKDWLIRRSKILMLLGLTHGTLLLWHFDVLFIYGLSSLFILNLSASPPAKIFARIKVILLILIALGMLGALDQKTVLDAGNEAIQDKKSGLELSSEQIQHIKNLEELKNEFNHTTHDFDNTKEVRLGGYFDNLVLSVNKYVEYAFYSIISHSMETAMTMLIGIYFFKIGLFNCEAKKKQFIKHLILYGYVVGLTIRIGVVWLNQSIDIPWYESPTMELTRVALTVGHVGLFLFLYQAISPLVTKWFSVLGRMALTNYMLQSICMALIFYGVGIGKFGSYNHLELMLIALTILIIQVNISIQWLKRFKIGPLEWVWRTWTYKPKTIA